MIDPEIEDEGLLVEKVRREPDGKFIVWMVGPLVHMVIGGASFAETQSNLQWTIVNAWNLAVGYYTLLWFHEFAAGGYKEADSLFSSWNGFSAFSYFVTGCLAGYAVYANNSGTTKYPIAQTLNFMGTLLGFWLHRKVGLWYDRQETADAIIAKWQKE